MPSLADAPATTRAALTALLAELPPDQATRLQRVVNMLDDDASARACVEHDQELAAVAAHLDNHTVLLEPVRAHVSGSLLHCPPCEQQRTA